MPWRWPLECRDPSSYMPMCFSNKPGGLLLRDCCCRSPALWLREFVVIALKRLPVLSHFLDWRLVVTACMVEEFRATMGWLSLSSSNAYRQIMTWYDIGIYVYLEPGMANASRAMMRQLHRQIVLETGKLLCHRQSLDIYLYDIQVSKSFCAHETSWKWLQHEQKTFRTQPMQMAAGF